MISYEDFHKLPKFEELMREIIQIQLRNTRPAEETILDDFDLCNLLKISKRYSAYLRSHREIGYSKCGGKIYYMLSDVLKFVKKHRIKPIDEMSILGRNR